MIYFSFNNGIETKDILISEKEIIEYLCDLAFEKLNDELCECKPIGETNVIECSCEDYIYTFELKEIYEQ